MELRDLVEDLGVVLERLEAMGEPGRYVDHPAVDRAEHHRRVAGERGRARAEVDDHVVDGAPGTADELRLGPGRHLIVHSAECALPRVERGAALRDARLETVRLELA